MKLNGKVFSRKNVIIIVASVTVLIAVAVICVMVFGKSKDNKVLSDNSNLLTIERAESYTPSSKVKSQDDIEAEEAYNSIKQIGLDEAPLLSIEAVRKEFGTFSYMLTSDEKKEAEKFLKEEVEIAFSDHTTKAVPTATVDNAIKVYTGLKKDELQFTLLKTHDMNAVIKKCNKKDIDFYFPVLNDKDNKYYYAYKQKNSSANAITTMCETSNRYEELLNPTKLKEFMKNSLKANKIYDIACVSDGYNAGQNILYFKTDVGELVYYESDEGSSIMPLNEFADYYYGFAS
ncbi:MAG: hypothetical protein RR436_04535 [Clostridia bacterium]